MAASGRGKGDGVAGLIRQRAARVAILMIIWAGFAGASVLGRAEQDPLKVGRNFAASDAQTRLVHLYFADDGNAYLKAEARVLDSGTAGRRFGEEVLQALLAGPGQALVRTIPAATELRALYITAERTAYVDLSAAVREDHPGGVQSELLTIYAIVNTLVLNLEDVARVQILIEGNTAQTLAGHIDISRPLTANLLLVR
jgi:spore germination protein GerM